MIFTFYFSGVLKEELRQRCRLDRRRLEEGLLLYWSLNRVQEYELLQLNEMPIPADLNELIAVISPLFHDGFIKKWISKLVLNFFPKLFYYVLYFILHMYKLWL